MTLLLGVIAAPLSLPAEQGQVGRTNADTRASQSETAGTRVRFVGNRVVPDAELLSVLSGTADFDTRATDLLLDVFRRRGHLEASVDSVLQRGGEMVVYVTEGSPTAVGGIRFVGNRTVDSEVLNRASGISPGVELSEALLETASSKVGRALADHGFPFATVRAGQFELGGGRVSFTFFVEEGKPATIDTVRLADSDALSQKSLQRALRIKPGQQYSEKDLERGVATLRRTGLFSLVGEPLLIPSSHGGVAVAIPVKNRKTTSIGGALGFRGQTNEVTGLLSLSVLNLARTGRSAKASWEAIGRNTSTLRFTYTEPWISILPFSSTVSFEHSARDTFFARTSLSLLLRFPVTHGLSARAGTSFEKTLSSDLARYRASRVAWLAGAEVFLGEPAWSSQNTFITSLELSRGERKRVFLSSGNTETRAFSTLCGQLLLQRRFLGNQVLAVDVSASGVLEGAGFVSEDELFSLGGKNTLRGYSERQFLAPTVGSVQLEYGLAVGGEGGRVFAFADCGYASTEALRTADRVHAGYGVGLRVPSPLGLAGIDLGIPAGESISSGKIHVGLEGTF